MQDPATAINEKTGWDELRGILKMLVPFAVLVWSAALCWTLSADLSLTAIIPVLLTVVTIATLFGPSSVVASVWSFAFRALSVALAIAVFCCLLYFGVKLTVAGVGWATAFPFRHPFLFIGGVVLLFLVAAGSADETANKKKTQFAHGPPFPKESRTTTVGTKPPCQAVESSEPKMFVYLMKNERNGHYKIGRSKKPKYRERTLQSQEPEVSLKWTVEGTSDDEKHLHRKYQSVRLRGEWFSLTEQDVRWITSCGSRDDLYRDATPV